MVRLACQEQERGLHHVALQHQPLPLGLMAAALRAPPSREQEWVTLGRGGDPCRSWQAA